MRSNSWNVYKATQWWVLHAVWPLPEGSWTIAGVGWTLLTQKILSCAPSTASVDGLRSGALTDILLKLNPRRPMIASSFISPVSTWLSIDTNKTTLSMVLFYSSSQTVSWFQQRRVTNVTAATTFIVFISVLLLPRCSRAIYLFIFKFKYFFYFSPLISPDNKINNNEDNNNNDLAMLSPSK